jgi:mannitol/fructose-specific phosphotransferase system IIA component (Ntr-type)
MNLTKYVKREAVILDVRAADKRSVIKALVDALVAIGGLGKDKEAAVFDALIERESLTSTGLGYGLAVPHVKTNEVESIQIIFGRSVKGIDFDALDGNPAQFFFLVIAPAREIEEYLRVLSTISYLMKDEANRRSLLRAKTVGDVFKVLDQNV